MAIDLGHGTHAGPSFEYQPINPYGVVACWRCEMSQEAPDLQDPTAHLYSGADAAHDGVCFTAGITGAPFAAGVIHAYLAADRRPPLVVAGISIGALSAAAMQRAYRELHDQKKT